MAARDGTQLRLTVWTPDGAPRALLVLVHGFWECAGRYEEWAARFTACGLAVYLHDQRGHGGSVGAGGAARAYDRFLDDVEDVAALARREHPGCPLVLYGHSMGGNVVLNLLLRRDAARYCCAVVTSPWLRLTRNPPSPVVWLLAVWSWLFPRAKLHTRLTAADLTRDVEAVRALREDGGFRGPFDMRLVLRVMAAGLYVLRRADRLQTPLLALSAGRDQVVSAAATARLAAAAPEGALVHFPQMYHELHTDPARAEVFEAVRAFLARHVPMDNMTPD
jgi:alpha-beta hydrolase superfamily lysophospholipase